MAAAKALERSLSSNSRSSLKCSDSWTSRANVYKFFGRCSGGKVIQRLLFIFACIVGAFTGLLLYDSCDRHCFLCTNIIRSGWVHCYGVEAHERTSAGYFVCCAGKTNQMEAIGTRRIY
jgi:hypothetical protein